MNWGKREEVAAAAAVAAQRTDTGEDSEPYRKRERERETEAEQVMASGGGGHGGGGAAVLDEDWEEWTPEKGSFLHHMLAGSAAGVAEHVSIFPIDTIKVSTPC